MTHNLKHNFKAKNNQRYSIEFSDDGTEVNVYQSGTRLGTVEFNLQEIPQYHNFVKYYYLVTSLNLENCRRIGIGTEIFRLHNKIFDKPIVARPNDGHKYDDGSHLTGDGVPFIQAMREKGYVVPEPRDDAYEYDE